MTENSVYIEIHTGDKEVTLAQFLSRVRAARKRKGLGNDSEYTLRGYKQNEKSETWEYSGDLSVYCKDIYENTQYWHYETLEYREDDMFGYYYLSTGERACK